MSVLGAEPASVFGAGQAMSVWPSTGDSPTSSFLFDGRAQPGLTFTRASDATYTDFRGYLATAATNAPRYAYDPALTYNVLSNPWGDGSPPTGWGTVAQGGITITFVSSGVRGGVAYTRWRLQGTSSNANGHTLSPLDTGGLVPTRAGAVYSGRMFFEVARRGAGHTATGYTIRIREKSSDSLSAGQIGQTSVTIPDAQTFASGPAQVSHTNGNAATTHIDFIIAVANSAGWVFDIDIDIGFPVLNLGASYLTDTVPLATLAARVGTTPQYGLLGLLLEEAATNGIRNPRAEGLATTTYASGLPALGTDLGGATNWQAANRLSGLSMDVSPIAFAGRTGMRVRWYGTTNGAPGAETIEFELRNVFGVTVGTPITGSFECRLVAGTLPGSPVTSVRILTFTSGAVLVDNNSATFTGLGAAITQPINVLTPSAGVGVGGFATVGFNLTGLPATTAADFTVDIFFPQIETSSFPTSRVLPPVATPGASTRARDLATMPNSLLSNSQASLAIRFAMAPGRVVGASGGGVVVQIGTLGPDGPRLPVDAAFIPSITVRSGGVAGLSDARATALTEGLFTTSAVAYGGGSGRSGFDGEVPVEDGSVTTPSAFVGSISLNDNGSGGGGANVVVKFLRLWARTKLSASRLQVESARTF